MCSKIFFLVIHLIITIEEFQLIVGQCDNSWSQGGKHCYQTRSYSTKKDIMSCQQDCAKDNGSLPIFQSSRDWADFSTWISVQNLACSGCWLVLGYVSYNYAAVTVNNANNSFFDVMQNETTKFTNWASGQPVVSGSITNKARICSSLSLTTSKWPWSAVDCSTASNFFVCQKALLNTSCNVQEGKLYYITNKIDTSCVMDTNTKEDQIITYPKSSTSDEWFYVKNMPNTNSYLIIAYKSNSTLQATSSQINLLNSTTCNIDQQFSFISSNGSNTCFISVNGKMLQSSSCASLAPITMNGANSNDGQQWYFVDIPKPFTPIYPMCSVQTSTDVPTSARNMLTTKNEYSKSSSPPSAAASTSLSSSQLVSRSIYVSTNSLTFSSSFTSKMEYSSKNLPQSLLETPPSSMSPTSSFSPPSHSAPSPTSSLFTSPSSRAIFSSIYPSPFVSPFFDQTTHSPSPSLSTSPILPPTPSLPPFLASNLIPTPTPSSSLFLSLSPSPSPSISTSTSLTSIPTTSSPSTLTLSTNSTIGSGPVSTEVNMAGFLDICQIEEWTQFSPCSATCGDSIMSQRQRKIIQQGIVCPYNLSEILRCHVPPCNPMTKLEQDIAVVIQAIGCSWIIGITAASLILSILFWSNKIIRALHFLEDLCLFLSHCIIAFARNNTGNKVLCSWASIGLQYFFLVHFTCHVLEAIHVLAIVTSVVRTESYFDFKTNLLVALGLPLTIVALTAITSYPHYVAKFSCWLNIGNNISFASILPILCCSCIAAVLLESAGQYHLEMSAVSNRAQLISAKVTQHGLLIILPINLASWFAGMLAIYEQNIGLFSTVFGLNLALGISIGIIHISANEKGRLFVLNLWNKIRP